nr:MAG TPA: hypothetical protein [Caudoviricetes sp.]
MRVLRYSYKRRVPPFSNDWRHSAHSFSSALGTRSNLVVKKR